MEPKSSTSVQGREQSSDASHLLGWFRGSDGAPGFQGLWRHVEPPPPAA